MNTVDMYRFLVVAKMGNVTRAAQALCIGQPALSKTLRRLEQQLDVVLFIRHKGGKGVSLTEAGQRLCRNLRKSMGKLKLCHLLDDIIVN